MEREKRNTIILLSIITGAIMTILLIALVINMDDANERNEEKKIYNTLSNFSHNKDIVYYYDDCLCYNNKISEFGQYSDILYVDENCIIHENRNNTITLNLENTKMNFDRKKISGYSYTFIYNDGFIYSYKSGDYFEYDTSLDVEKTISKEKYFNVRDGEKYEVVFGKKEVIIYEQDIEKAIISKNMIIENNDFSKIKSYQLFDLCDYKIKGENIYIQLYYKHFNIIFSYNLFDDSISLFDWFQQEFTWEYTNSNFVIIDSLPIIERFFSMMEM